MRRAAVLAAALLAVQTATGAAAARAEEVAPEAAEELVARAFDGERELPDAVAVAHGCGRDYGCTFRVLPGLSAERTAAVVSVGNTVINCTNKKITVYRTVVLESSTTDNLAGEISGSATIEGTVDNTTAVSGTIAGSDKTDTSHTDSTAPKDKGPNTDTTTGSSTTVSGSATAAGQLKLSATAAFQLAFKAAYSHEWKRTNTETTQVKFMVDTESELQFGMLNAMTRTVGVLSVDGTGTAIKNILVTSPSSSNVSTVVAQTFTAKDYCLSLRQPGRALSEGGIYEGRPRPSGERPSEQYKLTDRQEWVRMD
ncbi:hypothetical protein [Kitasatospora sp. NPDC088134]|uniref:hypothetical protein n=1 Tax=Kitasatospora sp. NPDC088134 TaxID=3364071 RepID=UPI0037FADF93